MKWKLFAAAVVLVFIGGVYVYFSAVSKPVHPAIKVLGLVGDPKTEPGTNLWTLSVALSNTTTKTFEVAFPTLQTGRDGCWTNAAEALDPSEKYASQIGPHGCATQAIAYTTSRPEGDWRLRFFVSEGMSGLKFLMQRQPGERSLYDLHPRTTRLVMYGEVVSPVFGSNAVVQMRSP
jgi:hypothetical protein